MYFKTVRTGGNYIDGDILLALDAASKFSLVVQ